MAFPAGRLQNADTQALEGPFDAVIHIAIFALPFPLKWTSRQIFAQDGPSGIFIAHFIVTAWDDEV